ncbi:MerR family transcriptional regulator [Streptomyces sp. NPDC059008]|uniref:MerR family transcriptional regulator n=1 Tax=Streptomyces sp. NPDC059008 TaxID=3346693 RepID=UPI0036D0AF2E
MPPADRIPAGYRRHGPDAVARLALVRTLRELGVGLDAIRQVTDRERTLGDVAAEHATALDVQINVLRLRRAVLVAAARGERRWRRGNVCIGWPPCRRRTAPPGGGLPRCRLRKPARRLRACRPAAFDAPQLPDSPTQEQVAAWVEGRSCHWTRTFAPLRGVVCDQAADLADGAATPPRRHAATPGHRGRGRDLAGRPWPWASAPTHHSPAPLSPGSPQGVRRPTDTVTTPGYVAGCCTGSRPRTIRAGTSTSPCPP